MLKLLHIVAWILTKLGRRRVIYDHLLPDDPYLLRHYIFGAKFWFGGYRKSGVIPAGLGPLRPGNHRHLMIALHRILKGDGDGQHSHPGSYLAIVLWGGYWEITQTGRYWRGPGSIRFRCADSFHRLEIDHDRPVYTLFFMFKRIQNWYFIIDGQSVPHEIHLGEESP